MTFAALHYHQAVKTGKLPIFETRAGPLCMRQMPWLFGTARIAQEVGVDDLNVNHIDRSSHVAVLCQGRVHKLTVLGDLPPLRVNSSVYTDGGTAKREVVITKLTRTFRFGRAIGRVANGVLTIKEHSEQSKPGQQKWVPYRILLISY